MFKTLSFFFLFFSFSLFSQTTIKGTVKDPSDTLLLGNVLLLSPIDSSLIKGFHYDFGTFSIKHDLKESALLRITSPGFEDFYRTISSSELNMTIELGEIKLTPIKELEGVEIVASIPLFSKSEEGGLVVNVQNTILGTSTSLLEVLSKSPNILIDGNIVSVVGKGEALLYKNGKRITFEQLSAIPVQSVSKIEIITNPSAKYDAEGRAVINFIMAPNPAEGFEVMLVQNFIMARHFLWAPAAAVSYRKGKFSLSANYNLTLGKDWNEGVYTRAISGTTGVFTNEQNSEENTRLTYVGSHALGMSYQLNDRHSISAEYAGLYNVFDLDVDGDNEVRSPSSSVTNLLTKNNGNTTNLNNSGSLNYNGVIDTLGSSIFIGTQYSQFNNELFDLIDENISVNGQPITNATRNNLGFNDINILTGRIDVAKNLKNGMILEFGGKYGDVTNKSKIDLYSKTDGTEFALLSGYSNDFEYREKIPAAYIQWKGKLSEKMNFSLGTRSEYSMVRGVSNTLGQTVIDTTYLNVFPNATLNITQSDNWSYSIAYASRITRPKYQDLDPFLWYQDSLTSVQGNPFLLPELVNGGEATAQFKTYSLKVGYNHSTNPSRSVIFPGSTGDGSVVLRRTNLQVKHTAFATLSVPLEVKFWRSYNTISVTYDRYQDNRPEFQVGAITPQLYAYSYNRFKVKKWFNIELILDYEGTRDDGIYRDNARGSVSVGLSKYVLKGDLAFSFLANDVLRTYRETGSATIGQVTSTYDRRLNTNFYRLTITYFFGKLRYKNYSNQNTGAEEIDRIKK